MLVGRAGGFHDRELCLFCKVAYVLFRHIYHRADDRHVAARQICDRVEHPYPSFKEKIEHEGLDNVIEMVPESDLVAAEAVCCVVQRAATHFCAERAGIVLITVLENDF